MTGPMLTPAQAIAVVVMNASINQMSSGIAEAESFSLPECANALKLARDYLTKDRDRCMAMWAAEKKVTEAVTQERVDAMEADWKDRGMPLEYSKP